MANICSQNIWQSVVPPEKMGRVFSVRLTIAQTSAPIAMILTGFAATLFGISQVILFAVVSEYVILIYIWYFTKFSTVENKISEETINTVDFKNELPSEVLIY